MLKTTWFTLDTNLLFTFKNFFHIGETSSKSMQLTNIAQAFAQIPYENLTKIIKNNVEKNSEKSRRYPKEVIHDHIQYGAGGTCFSLTMALLHLTQSMGIPAEPILADRHYGSNTHCALLVWIDGEPHILDPGFLIVHPIPLIKQGELKISTSFNELLLVAKDNGARIDLYTIQGKTKTHRLTFKTSPVDQSEFFKVWDDSFGWDMMQYPLLTSISNQQQIYLQSNRLMKRAKDMTEKHEIDPAKLVESISALFKIHPTVVDRALTILKQTGKLCG